MHENVEISKSIKIHKQNASIKSKISDGKLIPKGTNVVIGPYFMARDSTLWEKPLDFIPERFDTKDSNSHPFQHVPFGSGPKNCIGQKFAMLEMKSTISRVLRNFELSVAPDYEPILVFELILRSQNGVNLILNKRRV